MTDTQSNAKYEVDKDLNQGPKADRSCTDILCLLLFVVFNVAMGALGMYAFKNGDPNRLITPYDPNGRPCGVGDQARFKYIYFVAPTASTLYRTTCVAACPTQLGGSLDCLVNKEVPSCDQRLSSNPQELIAVYETKVFMDRICLPISETYVQQVSKAFPVGKAKAWMGDLQLTYKIIFACAGIAIVCGFLFMIIVRIAAGCVVWSFIFIQILGFGALGGLFFLRRKQLLETPPGETPQQYTTNEKLKKLDDPQVLLYMSIGFGGLAGLILIVTMCLCSRIKLAIAIVKCSAKFLMENLQVLIIPLAAFFVLLTYFVYWLASTAYLYSCGTPVHKEHQLPYASFTFDPNMKKMLWAQLFGMLWNTSFISAATQFIIIGVVAYWYFKTGLGTTLKAIYLFFRYHIGTVAFGSLLIAICELTKIILEYINQQAKSAGADQSKVVEMVIRCLQCYVDCFERCMKYINKNAYIQCVMTGKSFLSASADGIKLILCNPLRIAMASGYGTLFEVLGNICISVLSTFAGYYIITHYEPYISGLSSPIAPTFCFAVISFCVANYFMSLYGIAADTIIILFIMDEQMNGGNATKTPEELKDFIDIHDKK